MANGITRYSLHHEVVQLIFGQLLSQSPRQKKNPGLDSLGLV